MLAWPRCAQDQRHAERPAPEGYVPLGRDAVDAFVFWTKDPLPLMPWLDELDRRGHAYYFQFTLTPYGREIEPGLRDKAQIEQTFIELSRRIGRERVLWRYDPILLDGERSAQYHRAQFLRLCDALVSIPMTGHAESLNVASAAATCLFASQTVRGMEN